jgi:NADH:quinone reductase (non-electrogenic)
VTTMVLTPRIAESVKIPVVTVGGIANGKSLAAALALGASGVMMASRFLASKECVVHENIKKEIVRRRENETTLICKTLHLQGRALKNQVVRDICEIEEKGGGFEAIYPLIAGERMKRAWEDGDVEVAPMMVGQSIGLINEVLSCREIMEGMVKEAKDTLAQAGKLF